MRRIRLASFSQVLVFALSFSVFTSANAGTAGSIFLTGHDPDFHSQAGDVTGAMHINQRAIDFILDPAFNAFAAGGTDKFLFVESTGAAPGGHLNGVDGIVASGFVSGVDFDHHTAATLNDALDDLGIMYGGLVVASDFGGILTQAELDILNARSADIISFLNAGGGIYAMAESNGGAALTPDGGQFGFLPFVVSSTAFHQGEGDVVLTPFGESLGLVATDVTGNFSHNIFLGTFGLEIVDHNRSGEILSLAGRGQVTEGGVDSNVVPEPGTLALSGIGLGLLAFSRRRRREVADR